MARYISFDPPQNICEPHNIYAQRYEPAACGAPQAADACGFSPQHRLALHEDVLDEIGEERVASSRGGQVPRGIKRKMSGYPLRPRTPKPTTRIDFSAAIRVAK